MSARRTGRLLGVGLGAALLVSTACSPIDSDSASGPAGTTRGTTPLIDNPTGTVPPRFRPSPPGAATVAGISVATEEVGRVEDPVAFTARPSSDDLYIAEKGGRIRVLEVDKQFGNDGELRRVTYDVARSPLLDISDEVLDEGERGLLGIAFNSDGRKIYAYFTGLDGTIRIVEWTLEDGRINTRSRRELLSLPHPLPNHNGGQLAFGPDGFLYAGIGDGGGAGDPDANGQNPTNLYGTIIRIDPEGGVGDERYGIPDGNPFKDGPLPDGTPGAPEVWAWGLRNPWRFSWDRATADLWVGDVGQNEWEEIDFLPYRQGGAGRAANLGWSVWEGNHPFGGDQIPPGYVPPVFEYSLEGDTCAVTGGYVYRGGAIPALFGVYVYADYCVGELRGLLLRDDGSFEETAFGVTLPTGDLQNEGSITSFGEDNDGELWVLSADGGIHRIIPGFPLPDAPG